MGTPLAENKVRVIRGAFDLFSQVTVPLFEDATGPPKIVGTAIFIQHKGQNFLLSAGHVLKELQHKHLYYYVEKGKVRKVTGRLTTNHHTGTPESDLIDIAAVRMEGVGQPPYPSVNKAIWSSDDIQVGRAVSPASTYGFIGYPATRATAKFHPKELNVEPSAYLTASASASEYKRQKVEPWSHLCLLFNKKKSHGLDGAGRSFAKPHGVSGSPVFLLDAPAELGLQESFELAGIVTTWRPKEKCVLATSGTLILGILDAAA